jgi:hypothetical protein
MTKIKVYPIDTKIDGSDKWIGSDVNNSNRTKNFTVSSISDYFNSTRSIELSNALSFKYDTVEVGEQRSSGTFSFESEVGAIVPLSSITDLVFSKNTSNGKTVIDLMSFFKDNVIAIMKSDEPNIFGIYELTSYTQRLSEPNFYDVSLSYLYGNGNIEQDEFYFVSLLQLKDSSVSDKSYTHIQGVASSTWSITHSLNKFPSVTVVNINNVVMYGDVKYINENELQIDFSAGFSGKAYIN